jgi:hypothetical protein
VPDTVHMVLDWMPETGSIVKGGFHCPQPEVLEALHDAISSRVLFRWTRVEAAKVYSDMEAGWANLSFEQNKMEEVRLWASKG